MESELDVINRLDGTQGKNLLMLVERDNTLYTECQYNDMVEKGYFTKKQAKIKWHPTHVETWTYEKGYSRFNGGMAVLNRVNTTINPIWNP